MAKLWVKNVCPNMGASTPILSLLWLQNAQNTIFLMEFLLYDT
jgi:hypothetical protein